MPELPEVEAAARDLARWTVGRRLARVRVQGGRQTGGRPARQVVRILQGAAIEEVLRRGKWITARLDSGAGLALHLGMTGDLVLAEGRVRPPYSRASFGLDGGTAVHFVDPRRFGRLLVAARHEDLREIPALGELGPDALTELTPARLRKGLLSSRPVKAVLLDQRVAAGLGNIYAADALWRARVHPEVPASRVAGDAAGVRRLAGAIRAVLRRGLKRYEAPEAPASLASTGSIYGRAGEPCPRCGTGLRALAVAGRGTTFCPRCQRR